MTTENRIFLAHASEDKPQVLQLYEKLKARDFAPWLDAVDLIPGQNWPAEIPKAIREATICLACLSKRSVAKRGYVQREFKYALSAYADRPPGSIYLIPVRLDECEVPDLQLAELGLRLTDLHWVDLFADDGFEKLVKAIELQVKGARRGRISYLRTDEAKDVLCSLRHCLLSLEQTNQEHAEWKWVVLSLHSAVQGAMVCHLSGTANVGALSSKTVEKWKEWHDRDRRGEIEREESGVGGLEIPIRRIKRVEDNPPAAVLADFKTLLKRVRRLDLRIENAGGPIEIPSAEMRSILLLNKLRREFTHFSPKGWSIELRGLPTMVVECARFISKISTHHWAFRHMEPDAHAELASVIDKIADFSPDHWGQPSASDRQDQNMTNRYLDGPIFEA